MKKTNTKRIISGIIIAMMVITSLIIPASATETGATPALPLVYQSSTNFSTTSTDGTWDNGVWSATRVNTTDNTYTTITGVGTRGEASTWSQDGVTVDADEIIPYVGGTADAEANNHIGAAKTFTAPYSGTITISYAKVYNGNEPTEDKNVGISVFQINKQMSFRVRRQSGWAVNKIYPADDEYVNSLTNWSTAEMVSAETVTAEIRVFKGDKIHFEAKKTAASGDNYNGIYCDPIVAYTEIIDDAETRSTFKSSEYFDITSGASWDGVWAAMFYDYDDTTGTESAKYKPMAYVKNENYVSAYGAAADYNWGDRAAKIGTTYMMPEIYSPEYTGSTSALSSGNATTAEKASVYDETTGAYTHIVIGRDYPVKAFVAPKAGTVTIDADTFAPAMDGKTFNARIKKISAAGGEPVQVWPSGGFKRQTGAADFTPVTAEVKTGDMLLFEVAYIYNADLGNVWDSSANWDPTVTYAPSVDSRTVFKSSEYFSATSDDAAWDSGVWQARFYNWDYDPDSNPETATAERDKYQSMTGTRADDGIIKWANNASYGNDDYQWNSKAAQIGPEYMRVEFIPNNVATAAEQEYPYPIGRDYPVKVFAAPRAGVVSIDAATFAKYNTGVSVIARIMKMSADGGEPVQVWPSSGFKRYLTTDAMEFEPVTTALAEGDMLLFEHAFRFGTESSSPYDSGQMYWDPTVTYTDGTLVDKDGITFKSGEDTVTGFANIAAAESLTATVPVCSGTAYNNAVVIVGIYDANGMLVRAGTSSNTPIATDGVNNVSVTFGGAASGVESGTIKVFLWESLGSLTPLASAVPIQ